MTRLFRIDSPGAPHAPIPPSRDSANRRQSQPFLRDPQERPLRGTRKSAGRADVTRRCVALLVCGLVLLAGCASSPPVRQPRLANMAQEQEFKDAEQGVTLYARAVHGEAEMENLFETDLLDRDILPIRIEVVNSSQREVQVETDSIKLLDENGNLRQRVSLASTRSTQSGGLESVGVGVLWFPVAVGGSFHLGEIGRDKQQRLRDLSFRGGSIAPSSFREGALYFDVSGETSSIRGWRLEVPVRFVGEENATILLERRFDEAVKPRRTPMDKNDPGKSYREKIGG